MILTKQNLRQAQVLIVAGSILSIAFLGGIGAPMLIDALTPKPPGNPTTPRVYAEPDGIPVYPAAEGFGTHTPAGRGGAVIEVTSLADHGTGSLREALGTPGPRTIIFRVGGTIELEDELQINHPFVTVAGQSAPGGGIALKGAGLTITTHDVLIQHIRIRPGNEGVINPDDNDAVQILGKHGQIDGAFNVVLDHISASWSEDEVISTWYGAHDLTISWSIISEGLNRSRHRKETHSAGLLIGDSSYNVSVHHNLLAHNDFRNPLISEGGTHDFVNNLIYDWGVLPAEIIDLDGNTFINFIGNRYIPGPSTQAGYHELILPEGAPKIYVFGNIGPHRGNESVNEWSIAGFGYGDEPAPVGYRSLERFSGPSITISAAEAAAELILERSGATLPVRDAVDLRLVGEVQMRGGSIIDSPNEVGGYPELEHGDSPPDGDHDGLPDEWEMSRGMDPSNPTDRNLDPDGDGYTELEEYLYFLIMDN